MFNLKKHQTNQQSGIPDAFLIKHELDLLDIRLDSPITAKIGDHFVECNSVSESIELLKNGMKELKTHLHSAWEDLLNLIIIIPQNNAGNHSSINNLLFLSNVKKAFFLSKRFSDLKNISSAIKNLLSTDASSVHPNLIRKFNVKSLEIFLLHRLVMSEIYKIQLLKRFSKLTKTAQISGPWANLDLPMQERVWEYQEDEEYFGNREQARKNQTRYNPETDKSGFYYVWQDLTRDPYRFEDMATDSPYKSQNQLRIP